MKKSIIAIALTAVITSGCVPVVLVGAGAAVGGAVATDSRSLQAISDDHAIQFQANQKIMADKPLAQSSHITVTSFNYVVLLTGEVPSDAMRVKAESLVQSVPLVRRVYNQLKVAPNLGMLQAADDSTISTNIRARMMVTSDLNTNNFKYVVEDKVVYLMGYATQAQTQMAVDVIRNSSGVKRVVNLVQTKEGGEALPAKPPVDNLNDTAAPASVSADAPIKTTATSGNIDSAPQASVGDTAFVPVKDSSNT